MKTIWTIIIVFVLIISGMLISMICGAKLNYQAQAEAEIAAPADEVYRQFAVLENWTQWSPFVGQTASDVSLVTDEHGPALQWTDPRGGTAQLRLLATDSTTGTVNYEFISPIFPPMQGSLLASPISESSSKVQWTATGTLPNTLFYRLMSGNYDQSLSIQLQQSLERLKARYATEAPAPITE
ncbi:MAG: SRPBCC family protein [Planctomycetaceae bacterium]|nr:SRPBCC family protein [Planctomycetaceae bacterium]